MKSFLKEIELKFKEIQEQDKDGDGDKDFADIMMSRMKASGMSDEEAKEKSKKYNEEAKPDFLDLDKDGNKEEPMKQAAKQAKADEAIIANDEAELKKLANDPSLGDKDIRLKQANEDLEEQNVTGNLDGGAGPPKTPYAFGKKKRKYTYASVSEAMDKKYAAMIESYSKFATGNPKLSPSQTVNGTIKEVAKKLQEIEQLVKYTSRLKNESGIAGSTYGKSTHSALRKISERLLKISERVRSLGE